MKAMIQKYEERLSICEDDILRIPLMNQLLLKGIPSAQNENLKSIFIDIAEEIKYNTSEPLSIPKLEKQTAIIKNGRVTSTNTIVMIFADYNFKVKFYYQFSKKYPLNKGFLRDMKTTSISIDENLTKKNEAILKKCVSYKNQDKIAQTFTVDGIVYIKLTNGNNEKPFAIRTEKQLVSLVETIGNK